MRTDPYLSSRSIQHAIPPQLYMLQIFTTGQVARLCRVAPRTVGKWVDSGRLKGYRIPGSKDRRIRRQELVRFLLEYDFPEASQFDDIPPAVACGLLAHELLPDVIVCKTTLDLAAWLAVNRADAVVVGDGDGIRTALAAVEHTLSVQPWARVLLVLSEDIEVETDDVPDGVRLVRRPACWWAVLGWAGAGRMM